MSKVKLEEAINYAASTNKIEDMNLTKKELEQVKNAILKQKDSRKFLKEIKKSNGKNK